MKNLALPRYWPAIIGSIAALALATGVAYVVAPAQEARIQESVAAKGEQAEKVLPPISVLSSGYRFPDDYIDFVFPGPIPESIGEQMLLEATPYDMVTSVVQSGGAAVVPTTLHAGRSARQSAASQIVVTLIGNRTKPVAIRSIKYDVTKRRPRPFSGSIISSRPQGTAGMVELGFDLDKGAGTDARVVRDGIRETRWLAVNQLTLGLNERVTLRLTGAVLHGYVEWKIKVETDSGYSFVLDDAGTPFRTSAYSEGYISSICRNSPDAPSVYSACQWSRE